MGSRQHASRELHGLAHVEEESVLGRIPTTERHVAPQDVGCHRPREVDRILRASELGRVAELDFLEVVDRRAHLQRHGQSADPLVHVVLAERLGAEQAPRPSPVPRPSFTSGIP